MVKINSPLDPYSSDVELIERIDTSRIISLYKKLNLNVERFFNSRDVAIYECISTGYRFYYPFDIFGDSKFYSDLSKNRKNYYSIRWEHQEALKYITENDKVLEVGSGFGAFLNLLKNRNIKAKGLELNPYAVEKCIQDGLNVENNLITNEANSKKDFYEVLVSFQVLEHISMVYSFLEASIETIKKDGLLIIGVPNNNPYLFINDKFHTLNLPPHHAGLWSKKSLKSLEKIFPVQLIKLDYEPLELTYEYFINFQIQNNSKGIIRFILRFLKTYFPRLLKYACCKLIKGRNILAVYKKK